MAERTVRRRVIVTGHVQGVFYRASVQEQAIDEGVAGAAVNRPDGSVEVVLEGAAGAVASVIDYCRTGPVDAHVQSVAVTDEYPEGLVGFETR